MEQSSQGHFLLVPTGKPPMAWAGPDALTRSRAIQRIDLARRRLRFSQPQRACRQCRIGQVVFDRAAQGEPFPLAVFAQESEPLRDPALGAARGRRSSP